MIKIFALNDMEYWAGETLEACIEQAMADSGEPREVVYDPDVAYELTEAQMTKRYVEYGESQSFAERLQMMIDDGFEFPACFAVED